MNANDLTAIRVGAWCYGTALYQHCDASAAGFDKEGFDYLFQQAHFVRCYADEVLAFLGDRGVERIDDKHLQYFFSIEPPVFEPYMDLWLFCFRRMEEENMLPPNAEATLRRFMNDSRSARHLNA